MHNENEKVKSFKAYKRKKKNKNKRGIFKRKTGMGRGYGALSAGKCISQFYKRNRGRSKETAERIHAGRYKCRNYPGIS